MVNVKATQLNPAYQGPVADEDDDDMGTGAADGAWPRADAKPLNFVSDEDYVAIAGKSGGASKGGGAFGSLAARLPVWWTGKHTAAAAAAGTLVLVAIVVAAAVAASGGSGGDAAGGATTPGAANATGDALSGASGGASGASAGGPNGTHGGASGGGDKGAGAGAGVGGQGKPAGSTVGESGSEATDPVLAAAVEMACGGAVAAPLQASAPGTLAPGVHLLPLSGALGLSTIGKTSTAAPSRWPVPCTRSYEGHAWEAVRPRHGHPDGLVHVCSCAKASCLVSIPEVAGHTHHFAARDLAAGSATTGMIAPPPTS